MPTIKIENEKCKGCALCIDVCPYNLIRQERTINPRKGLSTIRATSLLCLMTPMGNAPAVRCVR
jgi:ferredoxin